MSSTSKNIKKIDNESIRLRTSIAGIPLEHPSMNGAGTCKTTEEVKELARSASAAIMVGSITLKRRETPSGEIFWSGNRFSLNSAGLNNPGAAYYNRNLPEMVKITHGVGKPLFVSIAGFAPYEYTILTKLCFEKGVDLVELNLSCPNVWKDRHQEPIICFSPELVKKILEDIEGKIGKDPNIAVKISPFSNPSCLQKLAKTITESKIVKAVTTTNTFPNALAFDKKGKPRITAHSGLSALGGPALKPIGLGQVKQLRDILPDHINIIGVGGITYGIDIRDYRLAGADAIQVTTALLKSGPKVFGRLLIEFTDVVDKYQE